MFLVFPRRMKNIDQVKNHEPPCEWLGDEELVENSAEYDGNAFVDICYLKT